MHTKDCFFILKRKLNVTHHYYDWRLGTHCMLLKMLLLDFNSYCSFTIKSQSSQLMCSLCGPIIKPQPERSHCTCEKGPSAPAVWLGYRMLSIWFISKLQGRFHSFFFFFELATMLTRQKRVALIICAILCAEYGGQTPKRTPCKNLVLKEEMLVDLDLQMAWTQFLDD